MKQLVRLSQYPLPTETDPLPFWREIQEISQRVKVIRFGAVRDAAESPWDRLAGMFAISEPVLIEEMLHASGDQETSEGL